MTLPAPAWRVKSRPCPYYQQGRCLFSDSCNFLHNVTVKSSTVVNLVQSKPSPKTPMKPPLVTIHSPDSARSSPRSPRLHGLLLALKDVIGEDPEDEYDPMSGTTYVDEPLSGSDTSADSTVFNLNHSLDTSREDAQSTVESSGSIPAETQAPPADDDDETLRLPSRSDEPEAKPSIYTTTSSPEAQKSPPPPQPPSDLLSPVEISHLHLGMFFQDCTEATAHDNDSIDSGYADAWKTPLPATRSPPHSPLKSTFGVLSSPFATASSRVLSPRLTAFISRPPQSPFGPPAVVDDDVPSNLSLDSPAGDTVADTEEVVPSEQYVVVDEEEEAHVVMEEEEEAHVVAEEAEEAHVVVEEEEEAHVAVEEEEEAHLVAEQGLEYIQDPDEAQDEGDAEDDNNDHDDEYDTGGNTSAASWDDHGEPTAVFVGMPQVTSEEVNRAIKRASRTPTHFLNDVVDFNEEEAIASSSLDVSGEADDSSDFNEEEAIASSSLDVTGEADDSSDFNEEGAMPSSSVGMSDADGSFDFNDAEAIPSPGISGADGSFNFNDNEAIPSSSVGISGADGSFTFSDAEPIPSSSVGISGADGSFNFDDDEAIPSSSVGISGADGYFNFNDDEAIPSSSVDISAGDDSFTSEFTSPPSPVDDSFEEGDESMDCTAQLAYLASPTAVVDENDTLQCLYDQYSASPEKAQRSSQIRHTTAVFSPILEDPSPDAMEIASLPTATPASSAFIRERVFTPPPTMTRSRSGSATAPADSPHSVPSPSAAFTALSRERASSHSQSARSAWSPDSAVSEVPEVPVSKKVPFGFRNSFASNRRATTSTLASSVSSRRDSRAVAPQPVTTSHSNRISSSDRASSTSPVAGGLRPLRLSSALSSQPASASSRNSTFSVNRYRQSAISHRASISSISVLSDSSYSRNPLLLSTRASTIPEHIRNTRFSTDNPTPSPLSSYHLRRLANFDTPQSAPLTRRSSWYSNPADNNDLTQTTYEHDRPFSRASEPSFCHDEVEEEEQEDTVSYDHTIRCALPAAPHSAPVPRRVSVVRPPMYALATPKPTLMFAIASDDVKQVRRVLESGDAGPNDAVGPQSALAFALTNDQLTNKMEIVKTLLAYGADPKAVVQQSSASPPQNKESGSAEDGLRASPPAPSLMDTMDPATRYYVERADAAHTRRTSALIHRSFFRPLTRVRYELIGQDRALEQLFKDLSMHSRQLSVTPIVVLLCGPSGHGKSLLARKFGSLLDVPTHTVDMTTIHSAQDIWKSYSMSPYDPPSTRSLAEFLIDNEGKRCVVVLDEIEKTHGESPLWALLMPWEHGRCTFEAHGRLVDVRNVVWLGTSNIGQDLVFEHHNARALPDELMSRDEYSELMGLLRPRVSERLGTSMLSRVTTVLPFVPFTPEERRAICYEALYTIAGDIVRTLPADVVDSMVEGALASYTAAEGARSLYRAVSNQLVDNI